LNLCVFAAQVQIATFILSGWLLMISAPELILDAQADLGEGPAWEPHTGSLYWVDIHAGCLHIFKPEDGSDRSIALGEYLGCAAPRRSGGLVLGLRSGFATIGHLLPSGEARVKSIINPEPHLPGNRFNDGKCDPAGRFLAGSMDDAEVEASGSLYSLAPDGTVKTLLTGTRIANGLTWSPDYRTFYFIDTPTRSVMAYDYDLANGAIANPRQVIPVPTALGWPDGMTCDSQGRLWVAIWGGAKLTRWDPASGQLLEAIPFPALNVSSCAFGGPDLTDLYVTSARKEMDAGQLAKYPFSGGLFRLHTDIQGLPTFTFGG
jgi:sugar lactone lactonase YvrE